MDKNNKYTLSRRTEPTSILGLCGDTPPPTTEGHDFPLIYSRSGERLVSPCVVVHKSV